MKIKIGPMKYEVRTTDRLNNSDSSIQLGEINYHDQFILMRPSLTKMQQRHTLIHECVHGILANAGVLEHSEALIEIISYGFLDLMRRNPKLIAFLLEKD